MNEARACVSVTHDLVSQFSHRRRLLRQVSEQVQRLVHPAGLARMGRPNNELALLQLQRQHERQEDKARLRVQQGLLSGSDSQRQRRLPQAEQAQFRPQAGDAGGELPSAPRTRGFGAPVLRHVFQHHHPSVSHILICSCMCASFFFANISRFLEFRLL